VILGGIVNAQNGTVPMPQTQPSPSPSTPNNITNPMPAPIPLPSKQPQPSPMIQPVIPPSTQPNPIPSQPGPQPGPQPNPVPSTQPVISPSTQPNPVPSQQGPQPGQPGPQPSPQPPKPPLPPQSDLCYNLTNCQSCCDYSFCVWCATGQKCWPGTGVGISVLGVECDDWRWKQCAVSGMIVAIVFGVVALCIVIGLLGFHFYRTFYKPEFSKH